MNSLCTQPLFLRILYISGRILNILRFVLPIVLIIKIIIDIYHRIINPDDKDGLNKIKTRIIAAVIVFLTPTIINVLYSFIEKNLVNYEYSDITICREFANMDYIKILEENIEQEQLDLYLDEKQQNLNARERYLASIKQFNKSLSAATEVGEYANNNNMIKCGSGSSYNTGLFNAVRTAGYKTRNGVVAAALYLSSHIDNHIPYFWSGGHGHTYSDVGYQDFGENLIGVSDKWGCNVKMISKGTDLQRPGTAYPFGMDCSGFVSWSILNGGYYTPSTKAIYVGTGSSPSSSIENISVSSIKSSNAKGKIKPGDIAFHSGHVGMIVEVHDDYYVVAEEQGYKTGLKISKINYGSRFTDIILMDNFYNNYKKGEPLWNGFK